MIFPGAVEFRRPDLRAEICTIIGVVCHAHTGGNLRLPVGNLVPMLGVTVAPEFQQQLDERGDLCFSGSRFANAGPIIRREVRVMGVGANLEIASPLRGVVTRGEDRFILDFEPGSSFRAGRFVFEVELARLSVTPDHVLVHFRGGPEIRIHLTDEAESGEVDQAR